MLPRLCTLDHVLHGRTWERAGGRVPTRLRPRTRLAFFQVAGSDSSAQPRKALSLVDLYCRSLQPPMMRTSWVVLGAFGWAVACGDDGSAPPVATGSDAGGDAGNSSGQTGSKGGNSSEDSAGSSGAEPPSGSDSSESTTGMLDGSSPSPGATESGSDEFTSSESMMSSSDSGGLSSATDAGCQDQCDVDSVRCSGEGATTVEQCRVKPSTGCTTWQTVEDCEDGACLGELLDDACDPEADTAQCGAAGLTVCAPGPLGCPIWQAPSEAMLTDGDVDIDEGATSFTAYGVLELKLTADVEAAEIVACLTDTREVATAADSPAVTQVSERASAIYDLELSRYQLPVAYELTVAVGSPPVVRNTVLAPDEKSRVAFISKTRGNGNLASWTVANDAPLEAADAVCQADAEAAGLYGAFRAYLSIKHQTDAICRLRGGEGLLEDGCGLADDLTEEQLRAPFLDMTGLPVAYGTEDIEQGLWRLPIGYDAHGVKSESRSQPAWFGTDEMGTAAGGDCDGWSSGAADAAGLLAGDPYRELPRPRYSLDCDRQSPLLCIGVQPSHPLALAHVHSGKAVFVSEVAVDQLFDKTTADQHCQTVGATDSVAWFSDDSDDALCRVIGESGKLSSNCEGMASFPAVGPWVRTDGYLVAKDTAQLLSGLLSAPINIGFGAEFAAPDGRAEWVRTDTHETGTWKPNNGVQPCTSGDRASVGSSWTNWDSECAEDEALRAFVYCFEK